MVSNVRSISPVRNRNRNRYRYNPYVSRNKSVIYHILSKMPTPSGVSKRENEKYESFKDNFKIKMFSISEEVEREYNAYKIRNENKNRAKKFSFYNRDGSFNCIGILLGMCSDDDCIREKAISLFIVNLDKILNSEDFKDLTTLCFSFSVFIYMYLTLFFNLTEFVNHKLSFLL